MSRAEWVDGDHAGLDPARRAGRHLHRRLAHRTCSRSNAPEDMDGHAPGRAGQIMRNVGGTLFAMQLGQVVGQLSARSSRAATSASRCSTASSVRRAGAAERARLRQPASTSRQDQVELYLAVRELAHARLFRHAKWLRLQLLTSDHRVRPRHPHRHRPARGARRRLRPQQPRGAARGDDQRRAHPAEERRAARRARPAGDHARAHRGLGRCGHRRRRPSACRPARRSPSRCAAAGRRAVRPSRRSRPWSGLELRPRRLREAAAMWQAVTDAVGDEQRDALWAHPDIDAHRRRHRRRRVR